MQTFGDKETSGMTDSSSAAFVYLDANPIAYALEGPDDLASALKHLFSIFRRRPGVAVTSELTLAEVLPKKKVADRHFLDLLVWSGLFDLRKRAKLSSILPHYPESPGIFTNQALKASSNTINVKA